MASTTEPIAMPAPTNWDRFLAIIRVFLAIVFATYGLIKLFGGQYNYGDWIIDKKNVDGTSLVWAFYGYSPFYGRFTGLFELGPALMLFNRRTATLGAGALFAVALNVTAMDFGFGYPAVKWFALTYTIMAALLVWADREKWALMLLDRRQVEALTVPPAAPLRSPFSPGARRGLIGVTGLFLVGSLYVAVLSTTSGPEVAAGRALASRVQPDAKIEQLTGRTSGMIGIDWNATMQFAVTGPHASDTMTVRARRISVLPWRITSIERASHPPGSR